MARADGQDPVLSIKHDEPRGRPAALMVVAIQQVTDRDTDDLTADHGSVTTPMI